MQDIACVLQVFLLFCTVVTIIFAKETPLIAPKERFDVSEREMKSVEDASPLLVAQHEKFSSEGPIMVPVEAPQVNGKALRNRGNGDRHGSGENDYHSIHRDEKPVDSGMGPGAIMLNLLTGVRKLPSSMKTVLVVMAFCWVSMDGPGMFNFQCSIHAIFLPTITEKSLQNFFF